VVTNLKWIKEAKQAVKMTRLSCHRISANEVRLWLSLIAYNLVRPVDHACLLLLVAAGGELPHTASVQQHVAEGRGVAVAGGLGCSLSADRGPGNECARMPLKNISFILLVSRRGRTGTWVRLGGTHFFKCQTC
jgi:Transposase DDE domain group 1